MENTPAAVSKKEAAREALLARTGELAIHYYRELGFHCPEATIRACSDALGLHLSEEVIRAASGFMGGGGGMGERCGVVEAGCMILSVIFARVAPFQEPWPNNYLIRTLHSRFVEKITCLHCRDIQAMEEREGVDEDCLCNRTIVEGAKIIAGVVFDADELLKNVTEADIENDPKPFEDE